MRIVIVRDNSYFSYGWLTPALHLALWSASVFLTPSAMKTDFVRMLLAKNVRTLSRSREVARAVEDQQTFDDLFNLLLHHERLLVVRAADAVERVTLDRPEYLFQHRKQLLSMLKNTVHKELKWHMPLLITRISLESDELQEVWDILVYWAQNPNESPMVRVHALQGLYNLTRRHPYLSKALAPILQQLEHAPFPSVRLRVQKLAKRLSRASQQ